MHLSRLLEWYQERIGHYDKQSWETTVEQRIIRGIKDVPKKNAKLKTDFIDVDLVRGSTFPKAKPQTDFWLSGCQGILRLFLLPFFWKWWIKETSITGFFLVFGTFFSVGLSCSIYILYPDQMKEVPQYEVYTPAIMLIVLSMMQSQIACTQKPGFLSRRRGLSAKRSRQCNKRPRTPRRTQTQRDSPNYIGKSRLHKFVKRQPTTQLKRQRKYECRSFSEELLRIKTIKSQRRSVSEGKRLHDSYKSSSLCCLAEQSPEYLQVPNTRTGKDGLYSEGDHQSSISDSSSSYFVSRHEKPSGGESHSSGKEVNSSFSSDTTSHMPRETIKILAANYLHSNTLRYRGKRPLKENISSVKYRDVKEKDAECSSHQEWASEEASDNEDQTPTYVRPCSIFNKASDWMKFPANGDDASYSSESDPALDDLDSDNYTESLDWQIQGAPAAVIPSTSPQVTDKVSCNIWEDGEVKKVNLSVLDISSLVVSKLDKTRHNSFYLRFGLIMAVVTALVPCMHRVLLQNETAMLQLADTDDTNVTIQVLGNNIWCAVVIVLSCINRFVIASGFLFFLSVAERTFRQRFLHAKYFCYLTSARRARKYDVPHFRLNKVVNIKGWLSVRSCLKKCGPQHSVDVIVSVTFILTLVLVSYLCFEVLKEEERTFPPLNNCEFLVWCFPVSIFLIRFMTLGAAINKKYANPSILVMEQINMYLHMEKKPHKKEELMLANNVLKLVSVLLKELDNPFKISGISANPLLYNVTKFVILSACSAVLSDLFGFKLKLHRIKFR